MSLEKEALEAVRAGANHQEVFNHYSSLLGKDAQDAIAAGADPKAVQTELNNMTTSFQQELFQAKPVSAFQRAGEVVGATAVGLGEGTRKFAQNIELLARDVFGDEQKTAARRAEIKGQREVFEKSNLGQYAAQNPLARKTGQVVGEAVQELLPATGASKLVGLGLKGAGLLKTVAQGAAGSAAVGAIQDPAKGASRIQNAVFSGIAGGALGVLAKGVAVLGRKDGSPVGQTLGEISGSKPIQNLEDALSRIPVIGMRGAAQRSATNIKTRVENLKYALSKDADNVGAQATKAFAMLDDSITQPANIGQVKQSIIKLAETTGKNPVDGSDVVASKLMNMASKLDDNFGNYKALHTLRAELDDTLFKDSGDLANTKFAKSVGAELRDIFETEIQNVAKKSGKFSEYQVAKKLYRESLAVKELDTILQKSYNKDRLLDADTFINATNKAIRAAPEGSPMKAPGFTTTVKGLTKLIDNADLGVNALKQVNRGASLGGAVGLLAGGGASYALGVAPKTLVATLVGGVYGLSTVLGSPTLSRALQKLANASPQSKKGRELMVNILSVLSAEAGSKETK